MIGEMQVSDADEMEDRDGMTDEDLVRHLRAMEQESMTFRQYSLVLEQVACMNAYDAKPYGDEVEGKSQVVVPVVQEVVDYMTISVLRTIMAGNNVVEFTNSDSNDESALEATFAVNQTFMNGQDGYMVLLTILQSGLIEKLGIVKSICVEDVRKRKTQKTLSEDELAFAVQSGLNVSIDKEMDDGALAVTISTEIRKKKYIDQPIPSFEYLFAPRTVDPDSSDYQAHRRIVSASELVEMGFDRDRVDELSSDSNYSTIDEREFALWEGEDYYQSRDAIPGMRRFLLREEYIRIDYDGDGIAELLRCYRVDNTLLEADEIDEQPFSIFCPYPRAHKMVGDGLADKVLDIQRNKTVAQRQTFDGYYTTNEPRLWLPEESRGPNTIGDLMTPGPGVIVRGKGNAPQQIGGQFDVSKSLSLMEYLTGEQESRTGITRLNQGLDADALNKTATGTALMQAQGQQQEEFIARNFAHTMARMFRKKMLLMIDHGEPMKICVDGVYRDVDPSTWPDDMDVSINVGLGTGKKDERVSARMTIGELQVEALAQGLTDKKRIYKNAAGLVRDLGLVNPNDYFIDPDSEDQQEPKPPEKSPEEVKAEVDRENAKMKADAVSEAAKLKGEVDLTISREKGEAEMNLAREQMTGEFALERERMYLEAEVAHTKAENDHHLGALRPGGSLNK